MFPQIFAYSALGSRGIVTPPGPDLSRFYNANIVTDGNSLIQTPNTYAQTSIPLELAKRDPFDVNATYQNFGQNGQGTLNMIADAATQIDPLFVPGRLNILIVWEIFNELGGSAYTPQQAVDHMTSYIQGRKAINPWKVVLLNVHHYTANLTKIAAANAIIGNHTDNFYWRDTMGADVLVDIFNEPLLQDNDNLTYYVGDKLHFATAGQEIVGLRTGDEILANL